ncbi:MAG: hypothetical protein K8M05_36995, partial [Deltaproteobacteria bacterium]|nr:hypothetical protein [Kofleriaceae bacterium]
MRLLAAGHDWRRALALATEEVQAERAHDPDGARTQRIGRAPLTIGPRQRPRGRVAPGKVSPTTGLVPSG